MQRPLILIWNKEAETMARRDLEILQLHRLQKTAELVYNRVPFYKDSWRQSNIRPENITSLHDLPKLPFTSKHDLQDNYPFGLLAVSSHEIVRIHATSGTTGKPVIAPYTRTDMENWAESMARVYTSAGVTSADVVHNAYGYGLFTGGLGFHLGAERIGATVVPVSGGLSKRQIMLIQDLGATVVVCTPSYALVLAETAVEMNVDTRRLRLRIGIFGAEPWTEEMRREIEDKMHLEAFDCYGLAEMIGPGVAIECAYHNGLHIAEDHFVPEVVEPQTGAPVAEGLPGELVLTSITKQGMPLLRYRTRDRVTLTREKCACGRTTARMSRIHGRTDDMLVVRGVNVFPSTIESVLIAAHGVEPQYVIVIDRPKHCLDELEIWIEGSDELWLRGTAEIKATEQDLQIALFEALGIAARVTIKEPRTLQRSTGKAKRVIDRRELTSERQGLL